MIEPVTIRILLLSDGRVNVFGDDKFALTKLTGILKENLGGPFSFRVDSTTIGNYSSTPDLGTIVTNNYHEAWFFGDCYPRNGPGGEGTEPRAKRDLSQREINLVTEFMRTAGVFATGDHKHLGAALNGNTVRVGKMRKWFFIPNSVDPSNAPPRNGEERHDTLRDPAGVGGRVYNPDWQEDQYPQIITTESFASAPGEPQGSYPHPLLSTAAGPIRLLPDHMHEGECRTPGAREITDLEFPHSRSGMRPLPLVIAKSRILESHETLDPSRPTDYRRNVTRARGLICAYDGHSAGVGRAVVDSSFHHFLDLNLKPLAASTLPGMNRGMEAYRQIKSYCRNIALWLAPVRQKQGVFQRILLDAALKLNPPGTSSGKQLIEIGRKAREIASLPTSPSFVLQCTLELVSEICGPSILPWLNNNWFPVRGRSEDGVLNTEGVVNAVIGGAVVSLADIARSLAANEAAYDEDKVQKAIQSGVARVVESMSIAADTTSLVGKVNSEQVTPGQPATNPNPPGSRPGTGITQPNEGGSTMETIWYQGSWDLVMPDGSIWPIRIYFIDGKPYVQLAPYSIPAKVLVVSVAPLGSNVEISFCAEARGSDYCFMIKFYYIPGDETSDASTLSYRYLKLSYDAEAKSAPDLIDDGSGTGSRPGTTKDKSAGARAATKREPYPVTGEEPGPVKRGSLRAGGDDGSAGGTQPGSTVEP